MGNGIKEQKEGLTSQMEPWVPWWERWKTPDHPLGNWLHVHGRRMTHRIHNAVAGNRMTGPITFLVGSGALAVAMTISTLYTGSYRVLADGEPVGVVPGTEVVDQAIARVEQTGTEILGYPYQVDSQLSYEFALTLRSELTPEEEIQNYFYEQLEVLTGELRKYQIQVDHQTVGVIKDQEGLKQVLQDLKDSYRTSDTVSAEFVDEIGVQPVYLADEIMTMAELEQALRSNGQEESTYQVVAGDTFNGIAYANDMSISDLKALNPTVDINRLMVGDMLHVKALTPVLSVQTVDQVEYTQAVPCPVETVEDPDMFRGESKILTQGVEGEEEIQAKITYLNGQETGREILATRVLRAPTATVQLVGMKEKPKTASTGTFQWPIRGRINSYFGGRRVSGRYSYHAGLDIDANYGDAIFAADGGTVTYAGYKGSYGNLVIITHDDGKQTYYAHNSSLLVRTGQKVYKGQQIARAGSTGRSTGVHCHFEVRVNGTAVNPLSYLP